MAGPTGQLQLIQGVPGVTADLMVDGDPVESGVPVGSVMALELAPGSHDIVFDDSAGSSASVSVEIASGQNNDVVYHLPAALGGDPVVSTYRTPTKAIGPGKARVLIAHTATLAPADVAVDGKTIFNDIANGEFAEAEVPAGVRSVSLTPSGSNGTPVLGPIDVTLKASTVTMVYAVGRPSDGTMQVITRSSKIRSDGTVVPDAIDTGSAGLAGDVTVSQFDAASISTAPQVSAAPLPANAATSPWQWALLSSALALVAAAATRLRIIERARATRPVAAR